LMNQYDEGPWTPQTGPQTEAILARSIPELLFGGAVFGGKTDFLLGDFLQDVPVYQGAWRRVLFARLGEMDDVAVMNCSWTREHNSGQFSGAGPTRASPGSSVTSSRTRTGIAIMAPRLHGSAGMS
jgi:hypothetical protein